MGRPIKSIDEPLTRENYSNIPCSRETRDAIKAEARAQGKWLYFYCEEILKKHLELGKQPLDDKKNLV